MRRTLILSVTVALLSTTLVMGGQTGVSRGAAAPRADDVVGSWLLSITDSSAPTDQPPIPALATFFADGTFIAADLPVRPAEVPLASPVASPSTPQPPTLVYSTAGHGVWTSTGAGRAALTFVELAADATGSLIATVTVSATVKLDETGDAIAGPFSVSIVGPDGQQLGTSTGTVHGTRIKIALIADFTSSQDAGTLDVNFTDRSTGDPTDWTWDFGDGLMGNRQDPTHGYTQPGDYLVTLTVKNADSTDTKTKTITVKPVPSPVADFTSSQDPGTLDVHFTDKSSGDPTDWTWDFGDSHTGTRQNPTHTYAKAGDYQVTLTVKNAGGPDTKTRTVTVKSPPPPVADFASSQDPGALDVHFPDSSTGNPTDWTWDFGDSHTGTRQNPTHTYAKAGDYQVTLTVKNVSGSDSKTRTVTVKPAASPGPS